MKVSDYVANAEDDDKRIEFRSALTMLSEYEEEPWWKKEDIARETFGNQLKVDKADDIFFTKANNTTSSAPGEKDGKGAQWKSEGHNRR